MKTIKLSPKQQQVVDTMKKYPLDMVMFNGCMTGGHGVSFELRTINALQSKGIIVNGRLTLEHGANSKDNKDNI